MAALATGWGVGVPCRARNSSRHAAGAWRNLGAAALRCRDEIGLTISSRGGELNPPVHNVDIRARIGAVAAATCPDCPE